MDFGQRFNNAISSYAYYGKSLADKYVPTAVTTPQSIKDNLPFAEAFLDVKAKDSYSLDINYLDAYCLIYTHSGLGQLSVKAGTYELTEGTLCFINCRMKYQIKVPKTWHHTAFYIQGSLLPFLYEAGGWDNELLLKVPEGSLIPHGIMELYDQLSKEYDNYMLQAKLILDILLGMAAEKEKMGEGDKLLPEYIRKIKVSFEEDCKARYTLDNLSAKYQISKYQICRDFAAAYGCSPMQYLNDIRIKVAKEALISTDKRVNEIGRMVGFDNTNNFIRIFRQKTGATPLNYRKRAAP